MRGRKRARKKDVRPIPEMYVPGEGSRSFASDVIFQRGRYLISMKTGWRTKMRFGDDTDMVEYEYCEPVDE